MLCWVLYIADNKLSSSSVKIPHFPPTSSDIIDVQELIKKENNLSQCIILNWKQLSEE